MDRGIEPSGTLAATTARLLCAVARVEGVFGIHLLFESSRLDELIQIKRSSERPPARAVARQRLRWHRLLGVDAELLPVFAEQLGRMLGAL